LIQSDTKSLPYKLSLYYRNNPQSSTQVLRSLYGEPSVQFSFKKNAINPNTSALFDIETVFDQNWFNETDVLKPLRYKEYNAMYTYRTNLELVYGLIMANEKTHVTTTVSTWHDTLTSDTLSWYDFTTADPTLIDAETYLIDLFSAKTSKNIPYFTLQVSTQATTYTGTAKEISLGANTPVYLNGGSDGTMTNTMFESLVTTELTKYSNPDSEVIDTAVNIETIFYDSGFTLNTKKEIVNFIAVRKNTAICLSTHDDALGEKFLPLSDERAVAVALQTRLLLAPESSYFGTPVMRGMIVAGTGLFRSGITKNRIPLSYELALKSASMMGAANYKWNGVKTFDHGTGAVLTELVDIEPAFIPAGIKPTLWNNGLVWAQPKDTIQYFFPSTQTVYKYDTSVLNSWTTVVAVCTINTIADDTWREFSGTNTMSDQQFLAAVTDYVNNRLNGIFANLLIVVPDASVTEYDAARGYSWTLINKLYAPNMKTVMTTWVQAHRLSDLTA